LRPCKKSKGIIEIPKGYGGNDRQHITWESERLIKMSMKAHNETQ
jgi:hypothetical protein